MLKRILTAGALAVALMQSPAHAANFDEESGFGDFGGSFSSCKSVTSTSAFATGAALAGSSGGGCVGYFDVDIDTTAKTITLTGREFGNYETGYLEITGITEAVITSLSTLSYTGLFDPNFYGDPSTYGNVPAPQLSFTGSSIRILFTSYGDAPPQFTYNGDGGQAVFAYNSTAGIPEPASWALMIGGFGLAGASLRRRRSLVTAA